MTLKLKEKKLIATDVSSLRKALNLTSVPKMIKRSGPPPITYSSHHESAADKYNKRFGAQMEALQAAQRKANEKEWQEHMARVLDKDDTQL